MVIQKTINVRTHGRGAYELTDQLQEIVAESGIAVGLCQLFILHTSASLIICENADPQVLRDLEAFITRLVPDGDRLFRHTLEGPDDMPAHIRTVLTQTSMAVPVQQGHCLLGTWQGIYLYEHRHQGHHRQVVVTVLDDRQASSPGPRAPR